MLTKEELIEMLEKAKYLRDQFKKDKKLNMYTQQMECMCWGIQSVFNKICGDDELKRINNRAGEDFDPLQPQYTNIWE